jgi:hypothetical protein
VSWYTHLDTFVHSCTYSYDGMGTGSLHATGDPDLDGSEGSQDVEMLVEKAGHDMDEQHSPPAGHPEQGDAGLCSPAPHLMWRSSADVHRPTRPAIIHVPHDPTELGQAYRYYIHLIGAHLKKVLSTIKYF